MEHEYEKRLKALVAKLEGMDDKELRRFIAEIYFGLQGAPVLMDFLIHKGVIDPEELKEYCRNKLNEAK